ncbi:MAG: hypothetical protein Q8L14_38665 [Myxococcales bacterium]|nr:hypothetical protein [Myxococcales bacterium]
MISLRDRYLAGEHERVYQELVALSSPVPDARAIAAEMLERVRGNVEELANRWRTYGFSLQNALCEEPWWLEDTLGRLESARGPLPLTIRAFYERVGWTNFAEDPPDDRWPDFARLDPLTSEDPSQQLEELVEGDGEPLVLFPGHEEKAGFSGSGPVFVQLEGTSVFDPVLMVQDWEVRRPDGKPLRFIPYLRTTILERGGIGPLGGIPTSELDQELLRELTKGLTPF